MMNDIRMVFIAACAIWALAGCSPREQQQIAFFDAAENSQEKDISLRDGDVFTVLYLDHVSVSIQDARNICEELRKVRPGVAYGHVLVQDPRHVKAFERAGAPAGNKSGGEMAYVEKNSSGTWEITKIDAWIE